MKSRVSPARRAWIAVCLISLVYLSCGTKKQSFTTDQEKIPLTQNKSSPFFYIEDEGWRKSSTDSLYDLYEEIDLSPNGFSMSSLGEFAWSEPAQVFVAKGDLTVFDQELRERFTNETVVVDQVICDAKAPIATISNGFSIIIVNLETQRLLKRYPLKGACLNLQRIANDQVLALVEGQGQTRYRYFFKGNDLLRIDSFAIDDRQRRPAFSPDLNYLASAENQSLVVENLGADSVRRIPIDNDFTTPLFSADGRRIILMEMAYHRTRTGKVRVFDFPALNSIYEGVFSGHRLVSLNNKRLVVGDELGKVEVVDIESGEVLYETRKGEIYGGGISSSNRLVISEKKGAAKNYFSIDINEGKILSQSSSNADFIVPKAIANNSEFFFFYFNDQVHELNLTTLQHRPLPVYIKQFYEARINADDSKIAFKNYDLRKIGLLDLSTYEVEYFHTSGVTYFFGSQPDELIVCTPDSSAVYNTTSKTWTRLKETIRDPQFLTVQQMMAWKNHMQEDELVFQTGNSWRNNNSVTHLNTRTFKINETVPNIDQLSGNLIGLDRKANYYLIHSNRKLYRYDRTSLALTDSIPGEFYRFYASVHSTPERDALTVQQKDRFFVLSPTTPDRYQFLKNHDFIWVSPNLKYLVQTKADKIRVYRWRKD